MQRRTYRGGVRLFDAALEKLAPFPEAHLGIDRAEAVARAANHRETIARGGHIEEKDFPKLRDN